MTTPERAMLTGSCLVVAAGLLLLAIIAGVIVALFR